jgi:hypothetical protein
MHPPSSTSRDEDCRLRDSRRIHQLRGHSLSFFLSMSGGLGSEPPEHGEEIFAAGFFIAIASAHYVLWRSSALPRRAARQYLTRRYSGGGTVEG